jgi:hypothetical protein
MGPRSPPDYVERLTTMRPREQHRLHVGDPHGLKVDRKS